MMQKNDDSQLIGLIKRVTFFSELPNDAIAELIPQFEKIELKPGQILFSQGDSSQFLYILIEGKLTSLLTKSPQGMITVGTINPVEIVGELGSLSGEPRSLTVRAETHSVLLMLPSEVFVELCQEHPVIYTEISKLLIERSRKTIRLLAHEHQVIIVFPMLRQISIEFMKNKFQEAFVSHKDEIVLLSSEQQEEIDKMLLKLNNEEKKIVIFLRDWNPALFERVIEKLSCFYVLVESKPHFDFDDNTKKILSDVKHIPNARVELILLQPDDIQHPQDTQKWLENFDFSLHHHVQMKQSETWDRLIRFMTGKANAVFLGGGVAKKFSHLGVIRAIKEKKVPVDAIGGTSIGAAIAACYAIVQDYEETLKIVYPHKNIGRRSLSIINLTWPIISLFSSHPMAKVLISIFNSLRIEDLWIPFVAVASDLASKESFAYQSGLLWEAIRSSISIPGLFPPIVKDKKLLFDGGLLNNLPVDVMRKTVGSNQKIIAARLTGEKTIKKYYNFPSELTLGRAFLSRFRIGRRKYIFPPLFETFISALLLGAHSREKENSLTADILISPDLTKFKSLSFREQDVDEMIEIGYRAAIKELNNT